MSGPLEGLRVLDLTRLLPGGYGTLLLADLGADVIKVEEPGRGDYIRSMAPLVEGESAIHRALNRGKRSITLDLKVGQGVEALRRLARGADAVLESFRPGVLDRIGVGYEALAAENPRLVYTAITGYGQDGPYRDRAGHDINYIGYAGLLHAAGPPDGIQVLPPVQVGDLAGGMAAALGTVACLLEARATGEGRFVDASMLDVAFSWLGVMMGWTLGTGEPPPRGGMPLGGGLACYRPYRTKDGRFLVVGALEPKFWWALCEGLGVPDLVERQSGGPEEQEEVAARLQAIFETRTREEWMDRLAHLDACVGPVNDILEAMADPHVRHRELVAEVEGERVGPGPALRIAGHEPEIRRAPGLGEHTHEILAEAGLSEAQIAELRETGAV
jgi:crotonobetainyl-CoA:carnitine CoA-transferase CaiB-like acyl-CoA transferase